MNKILGSNPMTTISGIIVAALVVIGEAQDKGIHDWKQWLVPVGIVVFGRLAGDTGKK